MRLCERITAIWCWSILRSIGFVGDGMIFGNSNKFTRMRARRCFIFFELWTGIVKNCRETLDTSDRRGIIAESPFCPTKYGWLHLRCSQVRSAEVALYVPSRPFLRSMVFAKPRMRRSGRMAKEKRGDRSLLYCAAESFMIFLWLMQPESRNDAARWSPAVVSPRSFFETRRSPLIKGNTGG